MTGEEIITILANLWAEQNGQEIEIEITEKKEREGA